MIKAVIFDLDGTLVQTEVLKARSYAQAAVKLAAHSLREEDVIKGFKEVVGRSRQEVASFLLEKFALQKAAENQMAQFKVDTPWQAFVQLRLKIYQNFLDAPEILRTYRCPYNLHLLRKSREKGLLTALATMSHREQTNQIKHILGIENLFDFVATRDDVNKGKPDAEIYQLVASQLNIQPVHCLVIEDSLSGVQAAIAAAMSCIAVTSEFTREPIHNSKILKKSYIVDDPKKLLSTVQMVFNSGQFMI